MLTLCLFGPGELALDGTPVHLHSAKAMALLAFLCAEPGRPHRRARLAALAWERYPEAPAMHSLRQALHSLRTCAGGRLRACLVTDADSVRFDAGQALDVDLHRFSSTVRAADPVSWRVAAEVYRAPLLDGHTLAGCGEYEEWLAATRARLHALAMQNLERLVLDRMAARDWDGALGYAERLRGFEPESEAASGHLMRILAATGQPGAVDAEWSRLRTALARGLGTSPSPASTDLYLRLRHRDGKPGATGRAAAAFPAAPAARDATPVQPAPHGAAPLEPVPPEPAAHAPAHRARSAAEGAAAVDSLVSAAQAAERVHAFGHALELLQRALATLRSLQAADAQRSCEILLRQEAMLERLGRRAEQRAVIDDAEAIARALPDRGLLATLLLRKAGALALADDAPGAHAAARGAAAEALALFRAIGDRPGDAEALRELGFVAWHAGEHTDALHHARDALAAHRALGDVAGEASALHNLGEIHRSLGSPRQALALFRQALPLHWAARNDTGEILTRFGEAAALRQMGETSEARRSHETALALSERHEERTMQSRALQALAVLCREDGALDDALGFMRGAVAIDRAINYAHGLPHDLVGLAAIHFERGERVEGIAALREALVWCDITGDAAAAGAVQALLADPDPFLAPAHAPGAPDGCVRSHLSLPEGKVYCQFESPLALAHGGQAQAAAPSSG